MWINCDRYGRPAWVRILQITYYPEGSENAGKIWWYEVDWISEYTLTNLQNPPAWSMHYFTDLTKYIPVDETTYVTKLDIVEPLTVKTTQELLGIPEYGVDSETSNIVDQIVGTNLWVKATKVNNKDDYYLHFNMRSGNVVDVDYVDIYLIDYPLAWDIDNGPPSESEQYKENKITHLDLWQLYQPVDFLTTEEIEKAYQEAEDYFWEEYNNLDDDYEDEE